MLNQSSGQELWIKQVTSLLQSQKTKPVIKNYVDICNQGRNFSGTWRKSPQGTILNFQYSWVNHFEPNDFDQYKPDTLGVKSIPDKYFRSQMYSKGPTIETSSKTPKVLKLNASSNQPHVLKVPRGFGLFDWTNPPQTCCVLNVITEEHRFWHLYKFNQAG